MRDTQADLIACIPRLRRYARALLGDRAGADDLVQDTMVRGWNKLASWRQGSDMRAWLFGIMHNLHVDQIENHRCRPRYWTMTRRCHLSRPRKRMDWKFAIWILHFACCRQNSVKFCS